MIKDFFASILIVLFPLALIAQAQDSDEFIISGDQLVKGLEYYEKEEYQKAIEEFNKISRNDTNYVAALTEIAVAYFMDKQYDKAYETAQKGLALNSEYQNSFYNTAGIALKNMDKLDEAEKMFTTALAKYPNDYLLHYNFGLVREKQRKLDLAIKCYENAIITNPFYSASHFRLGRIYAVNGKPIQAMLAIETYLLVNPDGKSSVDVLSILEQTVNNTLPAVSDTDKVMLPADNFAEIEELIKAKVSLNSGYKNKTKINYVLPRQTQLLLEKLTYNPEDKDFFMQFYVPVFTKISKNSYLEPLIYLIYSSVDDAQIQSTVKKNISKIKTFYNWYLGEVKKERRYRPLLNEDPSKKLIHFYYNNNRLEGTGTFKDAAETIRTGEWTFYYTTCTVSDKQFYDDNGKAIGEWKSYYKNGILKSVAKYSNGMRNGLTVLYYPNGVKEMDLSAVEDKLDGELKVYYPSGQLKKDGKFTGDKQTGPYISYYNSGGKEVEGNYLNGEREGEFKEYYETGEIEEISQYKNGMQDGNSKLFYKNGKVKSQSEIKNGKIVGIYKEYHENGNLYKQVFFDPNGVANGEWKEYYEDGKTLSTEWITDEKAKNKSQERQYTRSGKLSSVSNYIDGKIKDYKFLDEQGNVLSEGKELKGVLKIVRKRVDGTVAYTGEYKKGLKSGEWVYYDRNGAIESKVPYVNGNIEGVSIEYYINGNISRELPYKDGVLDGLVKVYYKNKNLSSKGWYKKGEKQGDWYTYYEDGTLNSKTFYLNDNVHGFVEFYNEGGKLSSEEVIEEGVFVNSFFYDSSGQKYAEMPLKNGTGDYVVKFPNGQLKTKGKYVNGNAEGEFSWYYANGKLLSKGSYLHDNKNGLYTTYFDNGKLANETNYKNGNHDGLCKFYFENGQAARVGGYKRGMSDSTWTYYFANGKKDYEVVYKEDVKEGPAYYYSPTGDLIMRKMYDKGKFVSYSYMGKDGQYVPEIPVQNETVKLTAYFSNGQISVEENVVKGEYDGKRTFYYPNGKKEAEINYKSHIKEGEEVHYYEDGKVKSKENFYYDELHGPAQYFRKNGNKEKEGNYVLGDEHGIWKYYDENGKLLQTIIYWYGQPLQEKK